MRTLSRVRLAVAWGLVTPVLASAADVNVTVYNHGQGLIRDTRTFTLTEGRNEVRLTDVAALIDPTTVLLAGSGLEMLEQNFEYDLASADRILERYLDEEVTAILKSGDAQVGTLVSYASNALVLVKGTGTTILARDEVERIEFPELPGGLTTRPTLVWELHADRGGEQPATLSYLTGGLGWHAEYVALVNADDTALELTSWISVDNRSGATYDQARLQLVAGDLHRAQPEQMPMMDTMVARGGRAKEVTEEAFFEYHLYTVEEPVTVKDRQTKQLALFPSASVPSVVKHYRYRGGDDVAVSLSFQNDEANGLGLPLPKGIVRVYKEDSRGGAQLAGEDRLDHTPKDEEIELTLGNAFDVVGERTVKDQRQLGRSTEMDVEVVIRNHKDDAITVTVEERAWGDWEVVTASHPHEQVSSTQLEFELEVPADGEATLTFTIRLNRG